MSILLYDDPKYVVFNDINYRKDDEYAWCGCCGKSGLTVVNDRCIFCDVILDEESIKLTELLYTSRVINENKLNEVARIISVSKLSPKLEPFGQLKLFENKDNL